MKEKLKKRGMIAISGKLCARAHRVQSSICNQLHAHINQSIVEGTGSEWGVAERSSFSLQNDSFRGKTMEVVVGRLKVHFQGEKEIKVG